MGEGERERIQRMPRMRVGLGEGRPEKDEMPQRKTNKENNETMRFD